MDLEAAPLTEGLLADGALVALLLHARRPHGHVAGLARVGAHVRAQAAALKRKLVSCSHGQELGQHVTWHLIGCTRVNNQSEARTTS